MKLDAKLMSQMTEKERTAIENGEAMAIPVARSRLSGMTFSVIAGLTVAAMIAATMVPVSVLMVEGALVATLGLLIVFKLASDYIAHLTTELRVLTGLLRMIGETIDKQQDKDGTNPKTDGLSGSEQNDKTG